MHKPGHVFGRRLLTCALRQPAATVGATFSEYWNLLLKMVGEVSGDPDDTPGAVTVWSFLHGYVSLERAGRFGASGPQGGFQRGLESLIRRRAAAG